VSRIITHTCTKSNRFVITDNSFSRFRTAEIAFGEFDDEEFINLKNYDVNPQRAPWSWTSNNSIFAKIGMDYSEVAKRIQLNGEPGLAWLDNMQQYSRMDGVIDNKDHRVRGANPCMEQSLENYELCCLVETFPFRHEDLDDFKRTLKFAYLYGKTVTLGETHWSDTNRVLLRNRRIGCSVSGIAQFLAKHGLDVLKNWLTKGYDTVQYYDEVYSSWFCIPRSIKTTSVKPSGTVSLLVGATPGLHHPESRFYIRRMRLAANSHLLGPLRDANYPIEPSANGDAGTVVVSFPIDAGEGVRTIDQISLWEQLALTAFLQRYWGDNQISATITFDPKTEGHQIEHALEYYQYQLKGISFLPRLPGGAYKQAPYTKIEEAEYLEMASKLKPLNFADGPGGLVRAVSVADKIVDRFCDGDLCQTPN
jgi:ribonucleoside-triphosphate reductase